MKLALGSSRGMPDGGFRPAFNVQYRAETKLGLVVGVGVGNAGARNDGFYAVNVRGLAKTRALALWHALARNVRRLLGLGLAWPQPA